MPRPTHAPWRRPRDLPRHSVLPPGPTACGISVAVVPLSERPTCPLCRAVLDCGRGVLTRMDEPAFLRLVYRLDALRDAPARSRTEG